MSAIIEETMGYQRNVLPRVVLIACGSFSPPTPMHFRMFEIAKDYFEMNGSHKVLGGIVSPTHDAYGKKDLAPVEHRCAMVKLALKSSPWIRLSDWEAGQPQWSRTREVLQYHQNFMNNYINSPGSEEINGHLPGWLPAGLRDRRDRVQLKLLCGADLLESFAVPGLWADEDIEEIIANHGLVVITRSGANPERFIFESDILTKFQRNITLVTNWVPNEVSSTMIRRLLSRGQSVKYLIDDLVIEYIKKNCLFNYKTKYITDLKHPMRNVYNVAYTQQIEMNVSSNEHTPSDEENEPDDNHDDDNDNKHHSNEERMDETDYSNKNTLNSDKRQSGSMIFCCGDVRDKSANVLNLLPLRTPGQAVKVIIKETGLISNIKERLAPAEGEQLKAKKMKITNAEHV